MKVIVVIGIALAIIAMCEGVTFTRCELVHELRKNRFPESKMRDWVCLVEHESGRSTSKVSPPNTDGSRGYGLFQIYDKYWCSTSMTPGKGCNVTCNALLTDNITNAARCAKIIHERNGFSAWAGWKHHCEGMALPDISNC